MVFQGMVYISHPTEYGTLYTKKELEEISEVCHKYELPLFLDGARLGYGLVSPEADVTLEDIARCTDVFYIGGTKVGALCGEAVVFTKKAPKHFMTMVKQQGALLAKGRLLGIQFDTLFTDDLYTRISKNAIETAMKLKRALLEKGYQLFLDSPTNQQFVVLENKKKEELGKEVQFDFWEKYDEDHTVIRFATSWGTKMEDIDALIELLRRVRSYNFRKQKLREVCIHPDLTEFFHLISFIVCRQPYSNSISASISFFYPWQTIIRESHKCLGKIKDTGFFIACHYFLTYYKSGQVIVSNFSLYQNYCYLCSYKQN